jgi:hypothetical protein
MNLCKNKGFDFVREISNLRCRLLWGEFLIRPRQRRIKNSPHIQRAQIIALRALLFGEQGDKIRPTYSARKSSRLGPFLKVKK